jgi:hypothetical protein
MRESGEGKGGDGDGALRRRGQRESREGEEK